MPVGHVPLSYVPNSRANLGFLGKSWEELENFGRSLGTPGRSQVVSSNLLEPVGAWARYKVAGGSPVDSSVRELDAFHCMSLYCH